MIRLFPLLLAVACVPDETGYLGPDAIYWSSTSESVATATEVVVTGVSNAAQPGETLIVNNVTTGAFGGSTTVADDGSFVLRVEGQLSDQLELSYDSIGTLDVGVEPSIEVLLGRDLGDIGPEPCGGCGPIFSLPDETGYVRPVPENLRSWQPPYVLLDNDADTVTYYDDGDPGLLTTADATLCLFGVDEPGPARTAMTCE